MKVDLEIPSEDINSLRIETLFKICKGLIEEMQALNERVRRLEEERDELDS